MSRSSPVLTRYSKRVRRRAQLAIATLVFVVPFVVHGAKQSVDKMRITPEKWVHESHHQRKVFEQFRSQFEGNDVVYVSWEGCTVDDPRLTEFQSQVLEHNSLDDLPGVKPYEKVISGAGTVAGLTDRPLSLSRTEALERLNGFLVGPDGATSCAVVVLTYDGNEHRREAIDQVKQIATEITGLTTEGIIIAGPPHDGIAIDDESIRGVNLFGALSTLVSAVLCFYCLRSVRIAGVILGIACLGQGIVLAAIYYTGLTLDAILIVSPPLIFVLTVSAGIHFVSYYRSQPEEIDEQQAVENAWNESFRPCWLAICTTAVGLASLASSRIAPIAAFGGYSAATLVVSVTLLMSLLPDALLKWPVSRKHTAHNVLGRWLTILSQWVPSNSFAISIAFVAVIAASLFGVQRIQTSVDPTSLFNRNTKIIHDYNWIEQRIGASVPVEVIIRFDQDASQNMSERVDIVQEVHSRIGQVDGIEGVMSAVTFLPTETSIRPGDSLARKAIINRRLHAARADLDELNYFHEDEEAQSWRVTGRVFATEGLSYGAIGQRIRHTMDEYLLENRASTSAVSVQYSGMMPLIEDVQVTILDDLFRSLLMAFALIGLSIFIVLRNFRIAMLVTILNTFPVLIVFGVMGGASIPIDIGTMMTAGVAMGIAVDDTVHFLCFYRNRLAEGMQPGDAIKASIKKCGSAMLQTSLICCTGMLVFAVSAFIPTRQFGLIMASILLAAIVSDLICLPALLLFGRRWKLWSNSDVVRPAESISGQQRLAT